MKGYFTFHPVGHGLFYTGKITDYEGKTFNIVYDIGSKDLKVIGKEVLEYTNNIDGSVDLLFISHLHIDHISGLNDLLKNTKVKAIILPYLVFENLIFLKNSCTRVFTNDTKPEILKKNFLSSFYANPYQFLNDNTDDSCKVFFYSSDDIDRIKLGSDYDEALSLEMIKESDNEFVKTFLDADYSVKTTSNREIKNSKIFVVTPQNDTILKYRGWCFNVTQPGYRQKRKEEKIKKINDAVGNATGDSYNDLVTKLFKDIKEYVTNIDCIALEHYPSTPSSPKNHSLLTGDVSSLRIYNRADGLLSSGREYKVVQVPHHGNKIPKRKILDLKTKKSVVCCKKNDPIRPNKNTEKKYSAISDFEKVTENNPYSYSIP